MDKTIRPIGLLAAVSILRQEARFGKLSQDKRISRDLERVASLLDFMAFRECNLSRVWPTVARLFERLGYGSTLQV